MSAAKFPSLIPGFGLAEDIDDLFVGQTCLHKDISMWLMKTLTNLAVYQSTGSCSHVIKSLANTRQADYPCRWGPLKKSKLSYVERFGLTDNFVPLKANL